MGLSLLWRQCGGRALGIGLVATLLTLAPARAQYCTENLQLNYCSSFSEYINSVSIFGTTLNNPNNGNVEPAAYVSWPDSGATTATLLAGRHYLLEVATNSVGTIAAWLDTNGNGQLEAREFIRVRVRGRVNQSSTVEFEVPWDAAVGRTLLRIRSGIIAYSIAPTDACTPRFSGETEDYFVQIRCVLAPPVVTSDAPICLGQPLTLRAVGAPANATYEWLGPNGFTSTDPAPVIPAATAAAAGIYQVTVSGNGCTGAGAGIVGLSPPPSASFAYSAPAYCLTGTATPTINGMPGGTFSASGGLQINPTTGAVDLASATPGTYTVTYSVTSACAGVTANSRVPLVIEAQPAVAMPDLRDVYCTNVAAFPLVGTVNGQPTPGTFTINGNPATVFDPMALGIRAHMVTYTSGTPGSPCASTVYQRVRVTAPAQPTVTVQPLPGGVVRLTSSSPYYNQWYRDGLLLPGATAASYDVTSAAQNGFYTVIHTLVGCPSASSVPRLITVTSTPGALAAASVKLYPTPTTDGFVTLEMGSLPPTAPVSIYDATGRCVWRRALSAGVKDGGVMRYRLDTRVLPAGLYVVHVPTTAATVVRQLVRE